MIQQKYEGLIKTDFTMNQLLEKMHDQVVQINSTFKDRYKFENYYKDFKTINEQ